MSGSPCPRSEDLRSLTLRLAARVDTYVERTEALDAPLPSFNEPFPDPVKDDAAQNAKIDIVRTCEKIMAHALGPMEWGMYQNMAFVDVACMGAMLELGIPEMVAPGLEPTALDEIVGKTKADKDVLKRIMRVCTQKLYFEEVAPEKFRHNGPSLTLLAPPINALVRHCCDDGLKSAAQFTDVLRETGFRGSDDPAKSAFSRAFGTEKGMFDYFYNDDLERGQRFGLAMAGSEVIKALTEDVFPFHTLPPRTKIVDVGGGRGQVSIRIAEKMPDMTFVVQDNEDILKAGQDEGVPDDVKDRIEWMPHSFFQEQPVKGADVYLFRFILHDHPDSNCVKIISRTVEAMDPERSRILIDDAVLPNLLGQDSLRIFNLLDIYMMMILNAKERTEPQWRELFGKASERLVVEKIWREPGTGLQGGTVLELRLRKE
ncbi:putative O-methyltransferase [Zopfia rhizophila CBS 207.26]|uniref:Putative O-methyltransferase n=1 Tax=Zopfia rhizophila CBS 207.26 TaxID=1314779 RepID=A0A6A6EY10_9PEZI|nr:putative O-methyltransferase [Zopfia rhizophila CBS 207.26]